MATNLAEASVDIQFLGTTYEVVLSTNKVQTQTNNTSEFEDKTIIHDFVTSVNFLKQVNGEVSAADFNYDNASSTENILVGGRLKCTTDDDKKSVFYIPSMTTDDVTGITTFTPVTGKTDTFSNLISQKISDYFPVSGEEDEEFDDYITSIDIQIGKVKYTGSGNPFEWQGEYTTSTISFSQFGSQGEEGTDGKSIILSQVFYFGKATSDALTDAEKLNESKDLTNGWSDSIPTDSSSIYIWMATGSLYSDDAYYMATGEKSFNLNPAQKEEYDKRSITYSTATQASQLTKNNKFSYISDTNYSLGDSNQQINFDSSTVQVKSGDYSVADFKLNQAGLLNGKLIIKEDTNGVFFYTGSGN